MALCLLLLGCRGMLAPARPFWPKLPDGHYMHVSSHLQVTGIGKSEDGDDALMDAWERMRKYIESFPMTGKDSMYFRMRKYIESLPVMGKGHVGHMCDIDQEMSKVVDDLVRSAEVMSRHTDRDRVAVVIRLDRNKINQTLGTDFRQR